VGGGGRRRRRRKGRRRERGEGREGGRGYSALCHFPDASHDAMGGEPFGFPSSVPFIGLGGVGGREEGGGRVGVPLWL